MNYPIYRTHPHTEPAVTCVIPYKEGEVFNPVHVCENDEVIVVTGGETIGHARIAGAKAASNEWIVQMDADAVYPKDYILKVKKCIREATYPVLAARRIGGFGDLIFNVHEHGLIVRRDVFLERCADYPEGVRQAGNRTDVADLFRDAIKIDAEYYHGFTKGERSAVVLGTAATMWLLSK